MERTTAEALVIGGGATGLTAAIALAQAGIETVLVAAPVSGADNRTTALLASSVTALEVLGVWEQCADHAAPLRVLRIVDATGRLIRAPEVRFEAAEIGLPAFGHNIKNRHLLAALSARADALKTLTLVSDHAQAVTATGAGVTVDLKGGGTLSGRLLIGADGRRSTCRAAAGIETEVRHYRQTALTFNLGHSRPHADTSTEFHTETGPFTLVPLPGRRSSLVFVVDPAEVPRLSALPLAALAEEVEQRAHSILGRMTPEDGRGLFPLVIERARRQSGRRIVLIGEAAHAMPPIGAQGLNLGLRDAATAAELIVDARRDGRDIGEITADYERMRQADVTSRSMAVDLLNRSLLSGFLPVHGARGLGLYLMDRIGPLRRAIMREGVMPMASQPRLMRGEQP